MPLFDWQDARKTSDGGAFTRAIRNSLTNHLPYFQPQLESIIQNEMMTALEGLGQKGESLSETNACSINKYRWLTLGRRARLCASKDLPSDQAPGI
jgi:hypothetical protein